MKVNKIVYVRERERERERDLSFGGRRAAEITHVDFTALSVHHDGNGVAFLIVEPANKLDDLAVPITGTVAHVDAGDVHSANGQGLQLVESTGGGSDGAHQLSPSGAPEPVLFELRLSDGVHFDGTRRHRVLLLTRYYGAFAVIGDKEWRRWVEIWGGGGGSDWDKREAAIVGGGGFREVRIALFGVGVGGESEVGCGCMVEEVERLRHGVSCFNPEMWNQRER